MIIFLHRCHIWNKDENGIPFAEGIIKVKGRWVKVKYLNLVSLSPECGFQSFTGPMNSSMKRAMERTKMVDIRKLFPSLPERI